MVYRDRKKEVVSMTEKTDNGLFSYQKKQNEYVTKTNIFKTRHDRAPN